MAITPLEKFGSVYLKREDLNITGSAKDRAISYQIQNLISLGFDSAVLSSSGNAAISAAYYCQKYHIKLTVFVSNKINKNKLSLIKAEIITSARPISDAFKYAKTNHSYLLRQSTDPVALVGYQQIALELVKQLPQITSIFVPVGSGTTLLGISQKLPAGVKIFAVQPASHCPIANHFDKDFTPEDITITDALSVKSLPLKDQVIAAIKKSHGSGIVIQNKDIIYTKSSPESALAYAGYLKIKDTTNVGNFPVVLFTGAIR